jgi:ABC-type multidrug transport system fused ATPase/permease subunit
MLDADAAVPAAAAARHAGVAPIPLPRSLYAYLWRTTRREQIRIGLLVAFVAPLSMVPLELQRRMIDDAMGTLDLALLLTLAAAYLGVVLLQGLLKYWLNLTKGRAVEMVASDLRHRALRRVFRGRSNPQQAVEKMDPGTAVSMLAAEADEVGGFAGEGIAVPLLQGATILWVMGYLLWVEPAIALLACLIYAPELVVVPRVQHIINELARKRTVLVRKLGHHAAVRQESADAAADRAKRAASVVGRVFKTRLLIYRRKYFLTFFGNLLDSLGVLVVLTAGGILIIRGETDIATLVVFLSGLQKLADPWDKLVNFYRTIANARVWYAMMAEALDPTAAPAP